MEWLWDLAVGLTEPAPSAAPPKDVLHCIGQIQLFRAVVDAAVRCDSSFLTALIQGHPGLLEEANPQGYSAWHMIAQLGKLESLATLATAAIAASNEGEDLLQKTVNQRDKEGRSPLAHACLTGQADCVRALIEYGADVPCADEYGVTPLHLAAGKGHAQVVEILLSQKADIMQRSLKTCSDHSHHGVCLPGGSTALHAAVASESRTTTLLIMREYVKRARACPDLPDIRSIQDCQGKTSLCLVGARLSCSVLVALLHPDTQIAELPHRLPSHTPSPCVTHTQTVKPLPRDCGEASSIADAVRQLQLGCAASQSDAAGSCAGTAAASEPAAPASCAAASEVANSGCTCGGTAAAGQPAAPASCHSTVAASESAGSGCSCPNVCATTDCGASTACSMRDAAMGSVAINPAVMGAGDGVVCVVCETSATAHTSTCSASGLSTAVDTNRTAKACNTHAVYGSDTSTAGVSRDTTAVDSKEPTSGCSTHAGGCAIHTAAAHTSTYGDSGLSTAADGKETASACSTNALVAHQSTSGDGGPSTAVECVKEVAGARNTHAGCGNDGSAMCDGRAGASIGSDSKGAVKTCNTHAVDCIGTRSGYASIGPDSKGMAKACAVHVDGCGGNSLDVCVAAGAHTCTGDVSGESTAGHAAVTTNSTASTVVTASNDDANSAASTIDGGAAIAATAAAAAGHSPSAPPLGSAAPACDTPHVAVAGSSSCSREPAHMLLQAAGNAAPSSSHSSGVGDVGSNGTQGHDDTQWHMGREGCIDRGLRDRQGLISVSVKEARAHSDTQAVGSASEVGIPAQGLCETPAQSGVSDTQARGDTQAHSDAQGVSDTHCLPGTQGVGGSGGLASPRTRSASPHASSGDMSGHGDIQVPCGNGARASPRSSKRVGDVHARSDTHGVAHAQGVSDTHGGVGTQGVGGGGALRSPRSSSESSQGPIVLSLSDLEASLLPRHNSRDGQSVATGAVAVVHVEQLKEHCQCPVADWATCPLTRKRFNDPVVACDGYTYERHAMQSWLDKGLHHSPTTGEPLTSTSLHPNLWMLRILQALDDNTHSNSNTTLIEDLFMPSSSVNGYYTDPVINEQGMTEERRVFVDREARRVAARNAEYVKRGYGPVCQPERLVLYPNYSLLQAQSAYGFGTQGKP